MAIELKPQAGSVHKKKRLGCGRGSGLGKTSGKGHKGQRARSGKKRPYLGFEGGQMPLYRRIPKRGFFHAKEPMVLIKLNQLEKFFNNGDSVNAVTLFEKGLIPRQDILIKVLSEGEITKKLNLEVHKVTGSAQEQIEKAGGSIKLIEG